VTGYVKLLELQISVRVEVIDELCCEFRYIIDSIAGGDIVKSSWGWKSVDGVWGVMEWDSSSWGIA
jgi:hypothetical protein